VSVAQTIPIVTPPVSGSWNQPHTSGVKPAADNPRRPAMLSLKPLQRMGSVLQFHAFDADYLESLRAEDPLTQEHFVCYFTELLHLKLRSRLRSPQAIEDVRQETFARVLLAIRKEGSLRQPDRLGPFVNTVCNNVLLEHYRQTARSDSLDEEGAPEPVAPGGTILDAVQSKQIGEQVLKILEDLGDHDRSLLKAVFLDERDRDDVCREFGVDRDYLRVLLHRAKHVFKAAYLKKNGNRLPFGPATGEA
jgi:RNA polymerase sigma-70 factor (ECF subfamily)